MIRGLLALLAAVLVCTPLAAGSERAAGTPVFGTAKTVLSFDGNVVGGLTEVETGDLNGDGIPDVVGTRLAYPNEHETFPLAILLGDGHGGFVDGSSMWDGPPARTEHGRQILIADFNGDRRNDIFVADHGYDADPFPGHQNALVLSTPAGKLVDASGNLPPESGFSHSAAAADVNHDGSIDIYVGNLCCGDHTPPEILLNDGTGHFTRRLDLLPPDLQDVEGFGRFTRSLFVDVNGDGSPDLVLGADDHTAESRVLLNDGTGHFRFGPTLPTKPLGYGSILISLASFDINGDGHPDLLAGFTPGDPFYTGRRIQVLIGNGDGSFRDETAQRLPVQDDGQGWPYAIRVADVNGDGFLDFGVSVNGAPSERGPLYLNDGTGVFHPVPLPASSPLFLFLDANGDGRVDLYDGLPGGPGGTEQHQVQLQLARAATPTGVRASRNRRDGIAVSWQAVAGATGYEVWRTGRLVGKTAALRYLDKRTAHGRSYSYTVRAVNELGPGGFSAPAAGRRL